MTKHTKPIKVPVINWQDKSTWTLAGLSNWTAQRDFYLESSRDAEHFPVSLTYRRQYTDHIANAPAWAVNMRSKSVLLALLLHKFAGSDKANEQLAIQAIIETYSIQIVPED